MSSPKYQNVIVFGPTGGVGGQVALEASKRGAKVWLAMRDPSKTIATIPSDVEKSGNFTRVQADLAKPDTVTKAIKESGAKAAYIYFVFTPDFLRGSLQAMRDAGVEYVVFLSTYSIIPNRDIREVQQHESIPFAHAQVEIAVEDVGFPYFTTLRAGQFASNHFRQFLNKSVKPPKANLLFDDGFEDNIVPEDIGNVGGSVLVERPSDGKEIIYLFGPQVITTGESWATIKKITGRDDIEVTTSPKEKYIQDGIKHGAPLPFMQYIVKLMEMSRSREESYPESAYRLGVSNIKKYSGREATKFVDYVEAHKEEWQSV